MKICLIRWAFLCLTVLSGCASPALVATPQVIRIYSTLAAQAWLPPLYDCAGTSAVLERVDDPATAEILLRVGEPAFLSSFAYQIDTEEILIVTHRESPVQKLDLDQARALFAGLGDSSVQVWVYPSGDDVQEIFDRFVMEGRNVMPSARVAGSPEQMSEVLVDESKSVGILPRRWKSDDTREVLSVATVPVLALTSAEPQGTVKDLIACLQP